MAQVTGIVKIYLDGQLLRSQPGATLNMGGVKRTAKSGHSVYGYSEEIVESTLDATLVDMADTDAIKLSAIKDATLRFETDTGNVYTVKGAWTSEPCQVSSGGDLPLKMAGQPAIKE